MLDRVTYPFVGYNMGNPFAIRRLRQKGVGKPQMWAAWSGHVVAEFTRVSRNDASEGRTSPHEAEEVEGRNVSPFMASVRHLEAKSKLTAKSDGWRHWWE
jgi:hypothetical protein